VLARLGGGGGVDLRIIGRDHREQGPAQIPPLITAPLPCRTIAELRFERGVDLRRDDVDLCAASEQRRHAPGRDRAAADHDAASAVDPQHDRQVRHRRSVKSKPPGGRGRHGSGGRISRSGR